MMQFWRNISLYWKCQLIGWSAASLYWSFAGYTGTNFSITMAVIHFLADITMYIALTHMFRSISRQNKWHELPPGQLLIRIIPATIILGIGYLILTIGKNYLVHYLFEAGFNVPFDDYIKPQWVVMLVAGIRLMAIWLLAYYLYHFAQREILATKESARLALIAKDAQLDNLSSQLNPHFFFNSLNNIKALVLENPHAARRAIDLLSELLRTALYKRDAMLIPLSEELALIKDYFELEKIRFEDRLETEINVDMQLLQLKIPPLSIQALVENAIKHGITARKEGGRVTVKIIAEHGFLITDVTSPGKLSSQNRAGLGLSNLAERLQLQFNGRASIDLSEQTADVVAATIKIPLS